MEEKVSEKEGRRGNAAEICTSTKLDRAEMDTFRKGNWEEESYIIMSWESVKLWYYIFVRHREKNPVYDVKVIRSEPCVPQHKRMV